MKLQYLPANRAWVFTFGDSITDIDGHRIFLTRGEAVEAARRVGLSVTKSGDVENTAPKTFEFAGNRYLLTADGLGAHRWIKGRGAWEKKVAVFAELNAEFQAAGKTAK